MSDIPPEPPDDGPDTEEWPAPQPEPDIPPSHDPIGDGGDE